MIHYERLSNERISPSGTTIYAHDGDNVVEELDGSGTAVARYTQGLGIDEPLAMVRGGASYYYDADGLGSITSLTDASGQIAASYTYDSFGKLTASTGTVTNPFRYTGREYGSDSGLYYYRARYYDSDVGRFISEDPIRFDSGAADFYTYVRNSPLGKVDPSGLALCTYFINNGANGNGWLVCVPDDPKNGGTMMIPAASGNNGGGSHCKNSPACTGEKSRGPISPGWWHWANGSASYKGAHGGRLLLPNPGNHTNRTDIYSHSCANPFGPSVNAPFCSEGCVTASPSGIRDLDKLIDAEPNSQLLVVP